MIVFHPKLSRQKGKPAFQISSVQRPRPCLRGQPKPVVSSGGNFLELTVGRTVCPPNSNPSSEENRFGQIRSTSKERKKKMPKVELGCPARLYKCKVQWKALSFCSKNEKFPWGKACIVTGVDGNLRIFDKSIHIAIAPLLSSLTQLAVSRKWSLMEIPEPLHFPRYRRKTFMNVIGYSFSGLRRNHRTQGKGSARCGCSTAS